MSLSAHTPSGAKRGAEDKEVGEHEEEEEEREEEPRPFNHGSGGGDASSGGGGGGLHGITAVQKAFHFLDGPADVLSASTACRRWRELACAGSVWRVKVEREGILGEASAFEAEVPLGLESGLPEDEGTGSTALRAIN